MYGLIAGLFVMLASVVGSSFGLAIKNITHKINDIILGFAAGVMLAAAFVGLLPYAFLQKDFTSIAIGILGILFGAILMSVIDKFVPHLHFENNGLKESETKSQGSSRVMLLVIAIAIHNIPEGLATGIAFSQGLTGNGFLVAISMIIQKIPEGLIIAVPMLKMGMSRKKVFGISTLVAFMMLPGIILGIVATTLPVILTSFFYGFTFGAIIYVISDEIIPESHQHGYQKSSTFALITGILVVTLLELLL